MTPFPISEIYIGLITGIGIGIVLMMIYQAYKEERARINRQTPLFSSRRGAVNRPKGRQLIKGYWDDDRSYATSHSRRGAINRARNPIPATVRRGAIYRALPEGGIKLWHER